MLSEVESSVSSVEEDEMIVEEAEEEEHSPSKLEEVKLPLPDNDENTFNRTTTKAATFFRGDTLSGSKILQRLDTRTNRLHRADTKGFTRAVTKTFKRGDTRIGKQYQRHRTTNGTSPKSRADLT